MSINLLGGWRNTMTFVLTGLDIDAKAALTLKTMAEKLGGTDQFADYETLLIRSDKPDAPTNAEASAQLRVTVKDADQSKVGRRFADAATELALAGYPGFHLTSPPTDATAYGVFWPALVPAGLVEPVVVHADGTRVAVPHRAFRSRYRPALPAVTPGRRVPGRAGGPGAPRHDHRRSIGRQGRQRQRGALGRTGYPLRLAARLPHRRTVRRAPARGRRARDPPVRAPEGAGLNFVVVGLLGEGVASSTRPDPQAKSLGEYVRSRLVDIPVHFLPDGR